MFNIPKDFGSFKTMFFDPGLDHLGVAIYHFEKNELVKIEAFTVHTTSYYLPNSIEEEQHGQRRLKLFFMQDAVLKLFAMYQPKLMGNESPFFYSAAPNAYGSLSELMGLIRSCLFSYDADTPNISLPPLSVKKEMGVAGKKGKEVMLEALSKRTQYLEKLITPLETLDEHAIDAICVGIAYYELIARGEYNAIRIH